MGMNVSATMTCEMPAVTIVKAKIIQALIQIERPINWDRERLLDTIKV